MSSRRIFVAAGVLVMLTASLVTTAAAESGARPSKDKKKAPAAGYTDPGTGPWEQVSRDRLPADCGLDPVKLDAAAPGFVDTPVAVFRHGRLCWSQGGDAATESYHIFSMTKTASAIVFGIIAGRTTLKDTDRADEWLTASEMQRVEDDRSVNTGAIHPDATVAHILAMTASSSDLSTGKKQSFSYDSLGTAEINRLIRIMDRAVQRSPEAFPGLSSAAEVARRELFEPLGMTATWWPGGSTAVSMHSSVLDMGRLGQLLLHKGRWNGRQILDEDYVYRMTHPSFEDSNTGMGYLTWLNAAGEKSSTNNAADDVCTPYATWQRYPHPPSFENPDALGGSPFPNGHDIGGFAGVGLGGQITWVHRGLDLVITTRDDGSGDPQHAWDLIRPALVALDPVYKGDEAAFCDAYRRSVHAPDLDDLNRWQEGDGFGPIDDGVDPSVDNSPAAPLSGATGLAPHRNSVGIAALLAGVADFDRTGRGYGDVFVTDGLEVVRPGESFLAQGFTYQLPPVAPGQPDNVVADGQTVFLSQTPARASKLGILGAGFGGSTTGTITLNYTDGSVAQAVKQPDWLSDGDLKTPPADSVLALRGRQERPGLDRPVMWSTTVPLDPARELRSVTLPRHVSFHVFDLQLQ